MGVLFGAAAHDGPAWYRAEVPARWLREQGISARVVYDTLDESQGHLEGVEAVLVQRARNVDNLPAIRGLKARGIRTLFELDDDVWRVPGWNPLRHDFPADVLGRMETILAEVDGVVVTTEALAAVVRRLNPSVTVVDNAVPLDLIPPAWPSHGADVRIGWAGSATHQGDVVMVTPILRRLLSEHPHLRMTFMGLCPTALAWEPQVTVKTWVPADRYYEALAGLECDVMIAPLAPHRFNESKSAVKFYEAAALGLPMVASDIGPYRVIQHGVTGFRVPNTAEAWRDTLGRLIRDADLRRQVGRQARAWVERNASMDVRGPAWADVLGCPAGLVAA